jgi:hypothetical protein
VRLLRRHRHERAGRGVAAAAPEALLDDAVDDHRDAAMGMRVAQQAALAGEGHLAHPEAPDRELRAGHGPVGD